MRILWSFFVGELIQPMDNWFFGLVVWIVWIPLWKTELVGASLESQTTNPNHRLATSWFLQVQKIISYYRRFVNLMNEDEAHALSFFVVERLSDHFSKGQGSPQCCHSSTRKVLCMYRIYLQLLQTIWGLSKLALPENDHRGSPNNDKVIKILHNWGST